MRGLAGRTAVVVGGAGGIGSAIVTRLAAEGAAARVIDLRRGDLASGTAEVPFAAADVSRDDELRAVLARPEWAPELLVNVAGVFAWEDPFDPASSDWERTLAVNLTGVQRACAAALPGMAERGFGRIVTVASNAAVIGFRNMPAYCAAKAGILGLTRALAVDAGPLGITVNAVAPGSIDAGMGRSSGWTSDERMRAWDAARTPLRRAGTAGDVAGAVAFLLSDDAAWITGQTLVVDGGFSVNGGPELDLSG